MAIITGPGVYRTRDGHEVHISNIDGVLERAFPAVGHIIKPDARGHRRRCFSLWALDGGFRAVGEHALDIVGVWAAEVHAEDLSSATIQWRED